MSFWKLSFWKLSFWKSFCVGLLAGTIAGWTVATLIMERISK